MIGLNLNRGIPESLFYPPTIKHYLGANCKNLDL